MKYLKLPGEMRKRLLNRFQMNDVELPKAMTMGAYLFVMMLVLRFFHLRSFRETVIISNTNVMAVVRESMIQQEVILLALIVAVYMTFIHWCWRKYGKKCQGKMVG